MKYLFILLLFPFVSFSQNGPINIHLKSGEVISTKYAFLNSNTGFARAFVRVDNKKGEKITIDRVSYVEGVNQNNDYKYFQPILLQGRNIWGERTYHSDRINIFYTNIITGTWNASYSNRHFQYQKEDQFLKKLNYSNLKSDLSDNPESMKFLKKGHNIAKGQAAFYALGAALVISSIISEFSNSELDDPNSTDFRIPPAFIAGAIALYIPWFMNNAKQNQYVNALKVY